MIIIGKLHQNIILFLLLLLFIFTINISIEYSKYKELIYEEVYETKVEIVNIYKKKKVNILRLKNKNFEFFTSVNKDLKFHKLDVIQIAFLTNKIFFI